MKNKLFLFWALLLVQMLCAETTYSDIDEPFFQSPRTTALGMTGVALGNTPESIFFNPALQSEAKAIQWYGSSYTLFEDVRTLHTAVTIPLGRWAIGLGYKTTQVPGVAILPLADSSVDSFGRPLSGQVKNASFSRNAAYLGAGFVVLENQSWIERASFGVALKSYEAKVNGAELREANANGFNLDLGLYAKWNTVWSTGLTLRNTMSSPLRWQNGTADELPGIISLGNVFTYNDGGFLVLLDADFYENQYQPNLLKAGVEVGLTQYLRLRTGLRQYLTVRDEDTLVLNGMTAGLGIRPLQDMSIDYSYFPGDGYAQNAVHYAGLSFESFAVFMPPTGQPVSEQAPQAVSLKLLAPQNYLITENTVITVEAVALGERAITINGKQVSVTDNKVIQKVALVPGNNELQVAGRGTVFNRNVYKLRSYAELKPSLAATDVAQLVLTDYYHQLPFSDVTITRKEAAEYIASSLQIAMPEQLRGIFSAQDILYLYGVYGSTKVTALGEDTEPLTKGELALLLARVDGYTYIFTDTETPVGTAAEALIATGYYTTEDFYPQKNVVSRRELISAVARSSKVTQRISSENKDWPLFWVNTNYAGCTVYAPNAGIARVVAQVNSREEIHSVTANGLYSIPVLLATGSSQNTQLTLNITDKFNNVRIFTIEIPPKPIVLEPTPEAKVLPAVAELKILAPELEPRTITAAVQTTVLAKTVPQRAKVGEKIVCYVGVMGVPDILKVTCAFADEKVYATAVAPGLWKAEKLITKQTASQYTVFVNTADGTYTAKGLITIDGSVAPAPTSVIETKVTAAPVSVTVPAKVQAKVAPVQKKAVPKQLTPGPRTPLKVPAYSPEIILSPAHPVAGSKLTMKVKVNAPRIVKVTIEVDNIPTYLTWSKQGFWYGEKIVSKHYAGKKMFLKVYVKDSAGKFNMTEKIVSVK